MIGLNSFQIYGLNLQKSSIYCIFDTQFSADYYTFSHDKKKATYFQSSNNNLYSDYQHYPVARLIRPFKKKFIVEFKMETNGWFGIGTTKMSNDGFPGYTDQAFAIQTNGICLYNKQCIEKSGLDCSNKVATMICDPENSLLEVCIDEGALYGVQRYRYKNFTLSPVDFYFFISVRDESAEIISLSYW